MRGGRKGKGVEPEVDRGREWHRGISHLGIGEKSGCCPLISIYLDQFPPIGFRVETIEIPSGINNGNAPPIFRGNEALITSVAGALETRGGENLECPETLPAVPSDPTQTWKAPRLRMQRDSSITFR